MCSVSHTSQIPSSIANVSIDNHSPPNNRESDIDATTSTPEFNLLLDKLTEILRFHSSGRRHLGIIQQQPYQSTTSTLKRLQSTSFEPLNNTVEVSSETLDSSLMPVNGWKSSNVHHKTSNLNRASHLHYRNHINLSTRPNNVEKKRRLPGLLQRLIEEGNLIKEAVHRLKSQRFTHTFKQQQNILNNPSILTTTSPIHNLSSLKSSSSSSISIAIPKPMSHSPTPVTSSPSRGISWFLSSNVFGVNGSTTDHASGSASPLRTCYSSGTHDRTPMEIGIYDG